MVRDLAWELKNLYSHSLCWLHVIEKEKDMQLIFFEALVSKA